MRETRASSSVADQSDSSLLLLSLLSLSSLALLFGFGVGGVWVGVCGGMVVGSRASKSEGSRPRGRSGGQVRWRFGVEGRVFVVVSGSSGAGACCSSLSLKERRRLRLLRGGLRGCAFVILPVCTVCDLIFVGCARGSDFSTMGLPRCGGGGARMVLGLGERFGRLLARSDCSARQVLNMLELGDWQVDNGGDSMVVAGV